ncbi:MAG: DUF916 domain-containing protein [Candidatus Saccharibacteria bacterium]|nr:DUF916 domain-containing protein [Candidatus Saccharibacteria bacterium]
MGRKHTVFIGALVILLGIFSYAVVQAQNDRLTLSISPPLFELSANPGDTVTNTIKVSNLSDEPQTVLVDRRNFTALGEEGGVDLTEDDTSYSLASWVEVDAGQTTIPARGSQEFDFTVSVPANAEPGGHFGSLVFKTDPTPLEEGQAGASVGQEIGSLLLVRVAGDIREQLDVASFESEFGFYDNGPVTLETRIENSGNVHVKPRGTITINDMLGNEVASVALDERNVLPDSIRKIDTAWEDSGLRFGRYTANLSLVYGGDNAIVISSTNFVMFPIRQALVGVAIIGVLVYVGYRYRDRFREAFRVLAGKN